MRDRDHLVNLLERSGARPGQGIGIGTIFWLDMRTHMLGRDPDVKQYTQADLLREGKFGRWRDHDLFIIPGNLMLPGMDNPRPWDPATKEPKP